MTTDAPALQLIAAKHPRLRRSECLFTIFAWSMATWLLALWVLDHLLQVNQTRTHRALLLGALATIVAFVVIRRKYFLAIHKVSVGPDYLVLENQVAPHQIPYSSVDAALGIAGISLIDAGDVICWKKLVLLTKQGVYTIAIDSTQNSRCYQFLRRACPRAWGIPFRGKLEAPALPFEELDHGQLIESLKSIQSYYTWQMVRSLGLALSLTGTCVVVVTLAAHSTELSVQLLKGIMLLGAMVFIGLAYLVSVLKELRVVFQVMRARRQLARMTP